MKDIRKNSRMIILLILFVSFWHQGEACRPHLLCITPIINESIQDTVIGKVYKQEEVAVKPEYPGGKTTMQNFLRENIRYPRRALMTNKTGKVFVKCIVDSDGLVKNSSIAYTERIKKNTASGKIESTGDKIKRPELEKEALRVVNLFPRFDPGKDKEGKDVNVELVIPITFFAEGL